MSEPILTILDLRDRCLAGDRRAWQTLFRAYGPLARHLLKQYFRGPSEAELLREVFAAARQNPADFWQSFRGTGQKEFLLHFRRHVMSVGRNRRESAPETPLTPASLGSLLKEVPLAQREIVILALKGYDAEAIGLITRAHNAKVDKIVDAARQKLGAVFDLDPLFSEIEKQRGEECLPDRIYVQLDDGGAMSWRDRDRAEGHFEGCLRCLVLLTDYREAHHFFRALSPLGGEAEASVFQSLGLASETGREKKPLWRRFWS